MESKEEVTLESILLKLSSIFFWFLLSSKYILSWCSFDVFTSYSTTLHNFYILYPNNYILLIFVYFLRFIRYSAVNNFSTIFSQFCPNFILLLSICYWSFNLVSNIIYFLFGQFWTQLLL
jgi:hypothetical protein